MTLGAIVSRRASAASMHMFDANGLDAYTWAHKSRRRSRR
jgi:hypothetical protein